MSSELISREQWYNKVFRILTSSASFTIAYVSIMALHWVVMGVVAKLFFKFDTFAYYYGVRFILAGNVWTRLKVVFIFGSVPVFYLFTGLFCLYLFYRLRRYPSFFSLVLLWGFVIGTCQFVAQGAIGALGSNQFNSPFYQELTVVYAWMRFPDIIAYLLAIPFAMALVYFGINFGKPFSLLAYSFTKVNKLERRRKYFLETAVVPFFIGGILTSFVTFPMNIFLHAIYLLAITIGLLVGWLALFYIEILKDDVMRYKGLQKLNFIALFLALLLMGFFSWFRENSLYLSI